VVSPPRQEPPRAPGLLWLFGETGIVSLELPIDETKFDESRSMDSYGGGAKRKGDFPRSGPSRSLPRRFPL